MEMTGDQASEREDDSGIESSAPDPTDSTVYVRVAISDLKVTKCLQFHQDDSVWTAKQRVLSTLAKDLKDGLNYGLYCPPMNGRAGKFLDEERPLRDYPLPTPIGYLELKYKRRVYKLMLVNPRKLRQLHTKANLKQFMEAVRSNNTDKLNKMLNKGLDPNFHDTDSGGTPLTVASSLSKPREVFLTLISGGAHIDFRTRAGLTCLHVAAQKGNYEAIKTLLDLGSSPNYKDAHGLTPLYHCVCRDTNAHCVEILLHDHSALGITDEQGWTEVHQACKHGRVQHLEHLLFYGADMNTQNSSGSSPLHICAVNNQESCARLLLFRGVDKKVLNYSNQDAFQLAVISGNTELAHIIKEYSDDDVVPFQGVPKYNEKRRATLTGMYTLTRSRSDPRLNVSYLGNSKPPSPAMSNNSMPHFNGIFDPANAGLLYKNDYDSDSPRSMSISSTGSCSGSFSSDSLPKSLTRARSMDALNSRSSALDFSPTRNEYSYSRQRLYPAMPGRHFICVKTYRPQSEAELSMRKGEFVEVLSVGERGYWEGKVAHREGWFPSYCVQEVHLRKKGQPKGTVTSEEAVLVRRGTLAALAQSDGDSAAAARTVVLQKGKQGFGFVLRGARSGQRQHEASLDFNPTPQFPALQYLDRVDRGSMADKAGLKPGDFVLEINGENVVNATHDHTVRVIKSSGDTLAMKVITVKPLSQDGMDVHMDGTRTLPVKKKEKLDHALAEYETNADSHSMGYSADAAAKGVDPNNKTASIRRQTKRLTSVPLDEIFTREEEVEVDPRRSASNQARPVVTGVPGRSSYGAQGLGRSHAVSTPNLSKEQQHMYIASQEDYSHHIARVELCDNDQGRAGAYPLHHSEQYSPGGHTVTNVRISTVASHDQVSYHKDPQERIYAVPYKGLPRHGSTEYMVDQDQSSADSGLSVQIGPNAGRALPPEPRAPPPPPPQDSRVMIPPPPTHPAPTPPSSEVGEMIPISTRSQHVYANVSADIMRRKAAPAPQEDDGSVESSFRPGAGARLSKQPAVLPKAAVIVKSDHSRSSSMSSNMSSVSEHSSGRMASHNIVSSQASIETENNVIVAPAASDVYYQRRTDNVPRNEPYYEPAPDYEIEGGSASETSSADSVRRSKVLSTPVPSPSQQKAPQDKNAFGDSIKAAALAREKRAREDEVRKQEEARQRQAAEEAKQRQAEEEAKRRKADEAKRRQLEVEAKQRQAAEEAKRKQIAEETKQRQAAEEAQRRKAAEETKQRQVAAAALAAKQRQASEEARRRELEEEAKRKRAEEELKQKQAAARQRYAAEEAKQKQAEEELRKRQEDEAARRQLQAAAEAKRKQEEQLKREEEGRRRQQEAQEKREAEERATQQKKIEAENERVRLLQAARVTTARQQVSAPPPPPPAPTSVPPPPPVAPPPPPPLEKRETTPPAPRQVPPHIQKELEDKKKRDQSHAALLAAVAKRRNLVDQRDNTQQPDSIDDRLNRSRQLQGAKTAAVIAEKQAPVQPMSQKQTPSNVKAEQTTKVFTAAAVKQEKRTAPPPPVSSPPPAATAAKASAVENKPEGGSPEELDFLAMAERKRMEWLQKKATSPTNTLERKPAKPKEQEAEADKKESPTKPPPPPEIKQYEPKPKPPPTQRSQSPERSAGLGNLASVIALRAQERQQTVDSKSDGKNNNNEPKKGGTVIYRSGQPSGNKANVGAPTTRPKPNVQKTTDWSEKTVEIKGATVDYSSTETPGASRTSSFLNRSAGKDSVNGQVQNGDSSHMSVTAKAKLFGSSVSKGSSRGVSSPHKDSRTPVGAQNNGNSFSPDDVPPPMIPPPQDFDSSSRTGQQHQSRSNGHSGSSWNSRTGPSRAQRGPGSPSKLAQLSPTRQGHSSVHSNDNGVTHMVLIPDDTSTSTDVDLPIVPPPPVFDSDFVQSGLPQVDDTASMASTVSTLSTLSSVADQDTLLHSSGLGIAPPPPPSDSSFKIEIAPPPPGFDDSPSDFIPPPMGFELDAASSKRNSSTSNVTGGGPSHSMMFPAVNKTQKAFLSKPIETWSIGDVGDWLDSIQLGEHRDRFSRQNVSGQKLVQMGRSELIALGVTQVGHRMSVERAIKKAMMRK